MFKTNQIQTKITMRKAINKKQQLQINKGHNTAATARKTWESKGKSMKLQAIVRAIARMNALIQVTRTTLQSIPSKAVFRLK